jgi:VanZ family protein
MIALRLRRFWLGIGIVGILLAFVLSLWPHGAPGLERVPDKLQHLAGYAMVSLWFVGMVERRHYVSVFIGAIVLGGVLEILQSFTETRQGDWADEGADALGALLALILAYAGLGGWMLKVERRLSSSRTEAR